MPSTPLDSLLPVLQNAIETELHVSVEDAANPQNPQLSHMLAYHLGWEGPDAGPEAQGKRIRPVIVLLSALAAGSNWKPALPAAAAVELIHNFSLIHDDIQDQSPVRRGRPTVWARWGAAQAINAGDLMFTLANVAVLRLTETTSPQTALAGSRILQDTCIQLTHGQYLDLAYEDHQDIALDDYWPMVGGKTAALLAASAELGALVAGTGPDTQAEFHNFGRKLGLAFQVQDDWLGIWGDAALTGKSTASDLISRKKTLPVLYALSQKGRFFNRWNQGQITPQDVPALANMLIEEGAQAYTEQIAGQLVQESLASLHTAAPFQSSRAPLEELSARLLNRKS